MTPFLAPHDAGGDTVTSYAGTANPDEQQLADTLVRMWSLASGRRLRPGIRPDQLSEDELIEFWADDFTPPSGRHAAADPERTEAAA